MLRAACDGKGLVLRRVEVVIGGVGYQRLCADATGGGGSTPSSGIQPLDVGGVRQYAERVRGAILGSAGLQQQTRNRTRIWATRVGAGGDHRKFVAPDYAAVEGALPRGAARPFSDRQSDNAAWS